MEKEDVVDHGGGERELQAVQPPLFPPPQPLVFLSSILVISFGFKF